MLGHTSFSQPTPDQPFSHEQKARPVSLLMRHLPWSLQLFLQLVGAQLAPKKPSEHVQLPVLGSQMPRPEQWLGQKRLLQSSE
jgi:hypothetical protein